MKKKFGTIVLAVIAITSSFVGCKDEGGETPSAQNGNVVLLSSFNEVKEYRSFKYSSYFGRVSVNKDEKYVTDGETSAKLMIDGNDLKTVTMDVFTQTNWCNFTDFTKVEALTVDVFNASDETREMDMGFTTRNGGTDRTSYADKTVTLKPGMNNVIFTIDRPTAMSTCYMDKVEYIHFAFPSEESRYELYIDNLRAHLTDEEVEVKRKEYEEGEILFFNDSGDRAYLSMDTLWGHGPNYAGTMSINRNPKYLKEGTGSLKVQSVINEAGGSPAVVIKGEPIDRIDFTKYSKISVQVCTDETVSLGNLEFHIIDSNDTHWGGGTARDVIGWTAPLEDGKFYTIEADLKDLQSQGLELEKIKELRFYYHNPTSGRAYAWYIDDLKVI